MKLTVESRTILWKKVSELRKVGKVPAVIYGKHLDTSESIVFNKIDFMRIYEKNWSSIPMELTGSGHDHLVLVADYQLDPVTDHLLHVDFHAVNKDEKVTANVPLVLIGVSPFEKNALGRVQLLKDSIEVEALPLDLPHDIKIDISGLVEDGTVIHISDLPLSANVEVVDDVELAVAMTVAFKWWSDEDDEETTEGEEEGTENEGDAAAAE